MVAKEMNPAAEVKSLAEKLHKTLTELFTVLTSCRYADLLANAQFCQSWNGLLELCGQVAQFTVVEDTSIPTCVDAVRRMCYPVFAISSVFGEKYTVSLLFAHVSDFMRPRTGGYIRPNRKLDWNVPAQKLSTRSQWGYINDLVVSATEDLKRIIEVGATVATKWIEYHQTENTIAWDLVLEVVCEIVGHAVNKRMRLNTAPALRAAMVAFLDLVVRFENSRSLDYNPDFYTKTILHLQTWARDPESVNTLE